MRSLILLLLLLPTALGAQSTFPHDTTIQRIIAGRTGAGGIVIGLLEPDGRTRFITAGTAGAGRTLDRETVFEIGSISKVFTGVLFADMMRRGTVSLEDPVQRYLPATVQVPARNGRAITLGDLARQRSGLPRLPNNLRPADVRNPYADYTVEQLYAFLNGYTLPRDPDAQFEYSNLGVGLLGHVLALRAGQPYEQLVRDRILTPLGMLHSGITLTPWMRQHMAAGHNASGDTVPLWDLPTLAGAGALRSNAEDMLKFVRAAIEQQGPLGESFRIALEPRASVGGNNMIGLLWMRTAVGADTMIWHNGGTGGFRTFAGFVGQRGVVLLTNVGGAGVDDIAAHLLIPSLPLAPPPRVAADVPVTVLQRYVGTYQLAPTFAIEITLVDGALWAQATNQGRLRIWPASETEFFYRDVEATITFELDSTGKVTRLVLHQNGRDLPGVKVK